MKQDNLSRVTAIRMKIQCVKGGGACQGSHPLICEDHGCALAVARAYGKLGGLKSRNQKQAARLSHSEAAEAKRKATRIRNGKANNSATPKPKASQPKESRQDKIVRRFWAKVNRGEPQDCWLWTGAKLKSGYGSFQQARAHRVSWTLNRGPIPKGKHVCHHCDTPLCVNPAHLFLGTDFDNRQDAIRKGRWTPESSNIKLDARQVVEIRKAAHPSLKALAQQYGVCEETIQNIRYGRTWKHVKPANWREASVKLLT